MSQILAQWIVSALCLILVAYFVPGFKISGFMSALIAAVVVGILNATIWWALIFLTLPINILSLGLFTFVVNAIVLRLAAALVPGFSIVGWGPAIFGACILALEHSLLRFVFR
jgi:putative membrane protein